MTEAESKEYLSLGLIKTITREELMEMYPMKPSEMLKDIEDIVIKGEWALPKHRVEWLIARVKRLTKALEWYADPNSMDYHIASEALEGDDE